MNYREIKIRIKDMKWSLSSHQPFTLQTQCHDGLLFFLCLQPDDLIPNLHLFFSLSSPSWFLLHQLSLAWCHPCPSAPSSPPTLRPSVPRSVPVWLQPRHMLFVTSLILNNSPYSWEKDKCVLGARRLMYLFSRALAIQQVG